MMKNIFRYYGFWFKHDVSDVGDIRYYTYRNNMILEMSMAGWSLVSFTNKNCVWYSQYPFVTWGLGESSHDLNSYTDPHLSPMVKGDRITWVIVNAFKLK